MGATKKRGNVSFRDRGEDVGAQTAPSRYAFASRDSSTPVSRLLLHPATPHSSHNTLTCSLPSRGAIPSRVRPRKTTFVTSTRGSRRHCDSGVAVVLARRRAGREGEEEQPPLEGVWLLLLFGGGGGGGEKSMWWKCEEGWMR